MTVRGKNQNQGKRSRDRRISVRAIHRDSPDIHKLSRALLELARAEAEAEAEAKARRNTKQTPKPSRPLFEEGGDDDTAR